LVHPPYVSTNINIALIEILMQECAVSENKKRNILPEGVPSLCYFFYE